MPSATNPSPLPPTQRVAVAAPPLSDDDRVTIQSIKSLEEAARASIADLNNLPKILAHAIVSDDGCERFIFICFASHLFILCF
jgi:hypothetical protein